MRAIDSLENRAQAINLDIVEWELTGECNLHCPFCYANSGGTKTSKGEYTSLEREEIFEQLKKIKLKELHFLGGEPLLRKDTIIHSLEENKGEISHFTITSNGTLITEEFVKKLAPYDDLFLQVALDGVNKDTQDSLRGKGTFGKVMKGVKLMNKYDIDWGTTLLITNINLDELGDIVMKVKEKGGKHIQILKLSKGGRKNDFYSKAGLTKNEEERVAVKIENLKDRYPDLVFTESFSLSCHQRRLEKIKKDEDVFLGCGAGLNKIAILPNKIMTPCVGVRKELGNSELTQRITNLDIERTYLKIKEKYLKEMKRYKERKCQNCKYMEKCYPRACQVGNYCSIRKD